MSVGAGTVRSRCNEVPWCVHTAHTATPVSVSTTPHTSHTLLLLLLTLQNIYTHCLSNPQRDPEVDAIVPFHKWENWGRSINGSSNMANKSPSKSFHFNIMVVNWLYLRYQNHGNKKPCFRILRLHYYYYYYYFDYYYFYRLQIRYVSNSFCFIPRSERLQVKHGIKTWW